MDVFKGFPGLPLETKQYRVSCGTNIFSAAPTAAARRCEEKVQANEAVADKDMLAIQDGGRADRGTGGGLRSRRSMDLIISFSRQSESPAIFRRVPRD